MKTFYAVIIVSFLSFSHIEAQITYNPGTQIPSGITIANTAGGSSNAYYSVNLTKATHNGRAAGGISIGKPNDSFDRFYLFYMHTLNNQFVGKFNIAYGGGGSIMTLTHNKNVGIGTENPDAKLAVNGNIHAREVKVDLNGWSDFVFENDYKLRSLPELETFIANNNHLPEIPNEAEVIENGVNLGQMDAKLLQKIEELTLYLIEQNKQLEKANQSIQQLQKEVSDLKSK